LRKESTFIPFADRKRSEQLIQTAVILGFLVFAGLYLMPIAWAGLASLKTRAELFDTKSLLPAIPQWSNYSKAWGRYSFARYFVNSAIVSISVVLINLVISSLAAYGLTHREFPRAQAVFLAIIATLMLPIEVLLVPTFLTVRGLGGQNTYFGLIAPLAVDAIGLFIMRQFMMGIPRSIIESARIDGLSEFQIYLRIVMPLCKPALGALAILMFRESWDAFAWPLIISSQNSMKTLPLGITMFQEFQLTIFNEQMAIAILAMIPTLLLFVFLQRMFVAGITLSGLKG
jgi:ABC-type glycerol-3-phosphate transport system permease component